MPKRTKLWSIPAFLILTLMLTACAEKKIDENDPAALFKEAEEEVKSDHFQMAIDKFRVIRNKFPYSKYSVEAQLRIADIYFVQESWLESAAAYETFRDLHPKHEKVAYAMFRIGKSWFNETPSNVARDLTSAQKALDAYQDFKARFPQDPLGAEAGKDIADLRNKLSDKEYSIAEFYFKKGLTDSAVPRLKKILELYPETDSAKKAQARLNREGGRQ